MQKYIFALLLACVGATASLAQSRVEKFSLSDTGDNRIVYALPQTKFYVVVTVEESLFEPGPFALYAERYLGIKSPGMTTSRSFSIKEVKLGTYGIADSEQRYTVQFKNGSNAPFVSLTSDGILCAINTDFTESVALPADRQTDFGQDAASAALSSMSEEYVQATSVTKQAEITAREIFRLRESRVSVVSGESEQPFPDGEAMKVAIAGIDKQEKALTERFVGSTKTRTRTVVIRNIDAHVPGQQVAFRFSETLGLLPKDDLRGNPAYIDVKILEQAPELSPKDAARKEKSLKGVIYILPGKVSATVLYGSKSLLSGDFDVAQLGSKESLAPDLFSSKKGRVSVIFNPQTGSVRRVNSAQ